MTTTRYYTTADLCAQGEQLGEDAHLTAHDSLEAAIEAASRDGARMFDDDYEFVVESIDESDCWAKVSASCDETWIVQYAADHGIHADDLLIRRPGTHPGGPRTWVSVQAEIFAAI